MRREKKYIRYGQAYSFTIWIYAYNLMNPELHLSVYAFGFYDKGYGETYFISSPSSKLYILFINHILQAYVKRQALRKRLKPKRMDTVFGVVASVCWRSNTSGHLPSIKKQS